MHRSFALTLFVLGACPSVDGEPAADGGSCSLVRGVDRGAGDSCCTTDECAGGLECVYAANLQGGLCSAVVDVGAACSCCVDEPCSACEVPVGEDGCGDGLVCVDGTCG